MQKKFQKNCKNISKKVQKNFKKHSFKNYLGLDATLYFQQAVDRKRWPDYYTKITNPIDLGTIRKNATRHYYQSRTQFLEDIQLLYENSLQYNGLDHIVSKVNE